MKIFLLLELLSLGQTHGNLTDNGFTFWGEMNQNRTIHIPKKSVSIILQTDGWFFNFLATADVRRFQPIPELYSSVRNDPSKFHLRWWFPLKIGAVQNWLQTQPKNFFFRRN
jgi:hypothetical protein